ncbi:hypothetical protein VTI74DRAFT_2643 [Chaetomium olivicolor]
MAAAPVSSGGPGNGPFARRYPLVPESHVNSFTTQQQTLQKNEVRHRSILVWSSHTDSRQHRTSKFSRSTQEIERGRGENGDICSGEEETTRLAKFDGYPKGGGLRAREGKSRNWGTKTDEGATPSLFIYTPAALATNSTYLVTLADIAARGAWAHAQSLFALPRNSAWGTMDVWVEPGDGVPRGR